MQVKELQSRIEGNLTTRTDSGYENLRRQIIWNQLTPPRYPELIVQVASEHDVVEAVRFARTHRMKIAVRGGGHSWVGFPLRDGSLLIDLGRLSQVSIVFSKRRQNSLWPLACFPPGPKPLPLRYPMPHFP
jgi:hypothetical protein